MDGTQGPAAAGGGPADAARSLASSLLALAETRFELMALELHEEAERRKRMLVLALAAAVFFVMTLLMVSLLVVALFWETHRIPAIVGITMAYFAIGIGAILRIRRILAESPPPFSASIAEFRKDLAMLQGRHD